MTDAQIEKLFKFAGMPARVWLNGTETWGPWDLDAAHKVEAKLSEQQQRDYAHRVLPNVCSPDSPVSFGYRNAILSSAEQRGEALLAVIEGRSV